MKDVTVLIAARNAEETIQRALLSVKDAGGCNVLLIDDFSTDKTVDIAKETYGEKLQVIQPVIRKNIGTVRAAGIKAVNTPLALWLDADDELLSGRIEAMTSPILNEGFDFVYGDCQLINGKTNQFIKKLEIPDFIKKPGQFVRQFERNWFPSIGWPAFKTSVAKELSYDTDLLHGEDYDIIIRAIGAGAKVGFTDHDGHKYYDYPTSLSRHLDRSRSYLPRILHKHSYEAVLTIFKQNELSEIDCQVALASMAIFAEDYQDAINFLEQTMLQDLRKHLSAPYEVNYEWLVNFFKGTCHLLLEDTKTAIIHLEKANDLMTSAELQNNLGVAFHRMEDTNSAKEAFKAALQLNPDFYDAVINKTALSPERITTHPLRRQSSRNSYISEQP